MALSAPDSLKEVRTIDQLLSLDQNHTAWIEAKEIEALADCVAKLEAREGILVAEAKGAAAAAASAVASQHVADLARRIGAIDERIRNRGRLPPED